MISFIVGVRFVSVVNCVSRFMVTVHFIKVQP